MKAVNIDYIAKAKKLSKSEQEHVLSRMLGKLSKHLQKEKLTIAEAIAIQLELEDEQLQEWRKNRAAIQAKANKLKLKADEKLAKSEAKKVDTPKVATPKLVKSKAVAVKTPVKKVAAPASKPKALVAAKPTDAVKKSPVKVAVKAPAKK